MELLLYYAPVDHTVSDLFRCVNPKLRADLLMLSQKLSCEYPCFFGQAQLCSHSDQKYSKFKSGSMWEKGRVTWLRDRGRIDQGRKGRRGKSLARPGQADNILY